MTGAVKGEFLAADAYPHWEQRAAAAEESVRVYSPYLDALVVSLLGNSTLLPKYLSVVTDLSPASGTLDYRPQLLALQQLLKKGVEVRSLPRLHAKVLLVDGATVTVGSQNFTSYARESKETTAVPAHGMSESSFVETLQRWHQMAEPVDLGLIEKLLDELAEPLQTAQAAIEALTTEYEKAAAGYRETQLLLEQQRVERAAATAAARAEAAIRRAAAASPYSAGQSVAYASLILDSSYNWILEAEKGNDLTFWRDDPRRRDNILLERLHLYPVLLGAGMRTAFARVGMTRISYVFRGEIHGRAVTVKNTRLYFTTTFPNDGDPDGANLAVTFSYLNWTSDYGYRVQLHFNGERARIIDKGPIGDASWVNILTMLFQEMSEDSEEWNAILHAVFAPTKLDDFVGKEPPNAYSFFPRGKRLRINVIRFAGTPVLLIQ